MIQCAAGVPGFSVSRVRSPALAGRLSFPAAITLVIALLIADSLLLVML
jgi:hypothetical protein